MILTESQLKSVIAEATKKVINELMGDMMAASFDDANPMNVVDAEDINDSFSKKTTDTVRSDEDNEFIARLKEMRDGGVISSEEYERMISSLGL